MRVLITGASGFVGGELGRHLRGRGWRVTGLSRREPRPGACDAFAACDLNRPVGSLGEPFDAVIHAAALSAPFGPPAAFERANVLGTRHALALRPPGARFALISSTSVFYRDGDQTGLTEAAPWGEPAINAYAESKRRAEALVRAAPGPWVILRPRAVFGVGDTVLFPRIARAARLRLLPRFRRPDGVRPVADLVSIDNLTRLIALALEREVDGDLNLTDGAPVDVEAFVTDALHRVGLPGPSFAVSVPAAMRAAGAMEAVARRVGWPEPPLTRFGVSVFAHSKTFDVSKAHAALGPPPVPTAEAMDRFVAWWRAGGRP